MAWMKVQINSALEDGREGEKTSILGHQYSQRTWKRKENIKDGTTLSFLQTKFIELSDKRKNNISLKKPPCMKWRTTAPLRQCKESKEGIEICGKGAKQKKLIAESFAWPLEFKTFHREHAQQNWLKNRRERWAANMFNFIEEEGRPRSYRGQFSDWKSRGECSEVCIPKKRGSFTNRLVWRLLFFTWMWWCHWGPRRCTMYRPRDWWRERDGIPARTLRAVNNIILVV